MYNVKATGEVFEIASYATIPMECCDSFGEPLCFCLDDVEILSEENDLKESKNPDYWARLEHQYAGMAMQGILSNKNLVEDISRYDIGLAEGVAKVSKEMAITLVEKYKEKEERK